MLRNPPSSVTWGGHSFGILTEDQALPQHEIWPLSDGLPNVDLKLLTSDCSGSDPPLGISLLSLQGMEAALREAVQQSDEASKVDVRAFLASDVCAWVGQATYKSVDLSQDIVIEKTTRGLDNRGLVDLVATGACAEIQARVPSKSVTASASRAAASIPGSVGLLDNWRKQDLDKLASLIEEIGMMS